MPRPFTAEEKAEVREVVRRGFTGRPKPGDDEIVDRLWRTNREEYRKIGEELRGEERDRLRSF